MDIKCLNINLGDINRLESNSLSKIEKCLYKPKNMVLKYLNYKEDEDNYIHVSKTSSSKKYVDIINAKYSVISVGKNNRFGHPNGKVLGNIKGSNIYRTDIDGSITFKINNNSIKIKIYNS